MSDLAETNWGAGRGCVLPPGRWVEQQEFAPPILCRSQMAPLRWPWQGWDFCQGELWPGIPDRLDSSRPAGFSMPDTEFTVPDAGAIAGWLVVQAWTC